MRAQEAIAAGNVGDVVGVNARLSNVLAYPTQHIRWAGKTDCAWFLLSHLFDLTSWLTGARANEVTASGVRGGKLASLGIDTFDIIHCLVRYDRGWSGLYESAWVLPNSLPSMVDFKFEIVGTEGSIYVDTHDQMVHVVGDRTMTYPGVLNWTEQRLAAFLDTVADRSGSPSVLASGLDNTALLVALHDSLALGAPVCVPRHADLLAAPSPKAAV